MPIGPLLRQCYNNNVPCIPSSNEKTFDSDPLITKGLPIASVATVAFIALRYKKARFAKNTWPYWGGRIDFIARQGWGIKGIEISDRAMQWPFQQVERINLRPKHFSMTVNLPKDRDRFKWIWKPSFDDVESSSWDEKDALTKYAALRMKYNEDEISLILRNKINHCFKTICENESIDTISSKEAKLRLYKKILHDLKPDLEKLGIALDRDSVWNGWEPDWLAIG